MIWIPVWLIPAVRRDFPGPVPQIFRCIESAARKVIEQYYVKYVERVHHLKGLPADEKYHLFQKHYGDFVHRIPLKYVADYLGITSETLSRIRAKENKKKRIN